jgi:type I restriction enzyme S subunit
VNPALFVKQGDFLFSRANTIELVGACVVVGTVTKRIMLSDKILRFHFLAPVENWTLYFLRSIAGRKEIEHYATGNQDSMRNIGQERIRRIQMPLAPLPEQHRIVAEIEKQFTRLDAAVANLERVKANLKRARASVLKAAVEGRLVPTEAALARAEGRDYEPASVLLEQIKAPPRPNKWNSRSEKVIAGHAALAVCNPGTPLPDGWQWAQLADIARMESGHTPSRRHPEWWDGDVRWISIPDAREHHGRVIHETVQHTNTEGLANSAARLLPEGTVCLSRTASVGYVVIMGRPMATSQDFVNWIPTRAISPEWLQVVLMADKDALLRFGKGTVHTTIYFPEVLSFHVAVPPFAEQTRIVAEVERRLSVIDAVDTAAEVNLARCNRLRQSILKRAFEGKLVPQDPTDEPANELLARIQADAELPMQKRTKEQTAAKKSTRSKK